MLHVFCLLSELGFIHISHLYWAHRPVIARPPPPPSSFIHHRELDVQLSCCRDRCVARRPAAIVWPRLFLAYYYLDLCRAEPASYCPCSVDCVSCVSLLSLDSSTRRRKRNVASSPLPPFPDPPLCRVHGYRRALSLGAFDLSTRPWLPRRSRGLTIPVAAWDLRSCEGEVCRELGTGALFIFDGYRLRSMPVHALMETARNIH